MTSTPVHRSFPEGFLWGAASAGHQVEGDNVNSDTWFVENVTPTVFAEPSGRACNSYELWQTDLDLTRGLGLNAVRFSIEWARVEPTEGHFDAAAIEHYAEMLRYALATGLTPVVTLNHFTSPHWFAAAGGWMNENAAAWFVRYCERLVGDLGDLLSYVLTFNEPDLPRLLTHIGLPDFIVELHRQTLAAAASAAGVAHYRPSNVVLDEDIAPLELAMMDGHRKVRARMKELRPSLKVGLSLAVIDDRVIGDDATVRDAKRSVLYDPWLDLARDDDFLGVQNYEAQYYDGNGPVAPPEGSPRNQMGSLVDPTSLAGCVRYCFERAGVPILVTEHGMSTDDDRPRAEFIGPSLVALHETITDGIPVIGYIHWALLDNFEWIFGYKVRFGLHAVDRETFVRTAKPSAAVLGSIATANCV